MMLSFREDSRLTVRRLTAFFKSSTTPGSLNYSASSNSTDLSAPQPRKIRRKTLMPRLMCTALEKSFNSNDSADSSGILKVPWDEWRRRRSTSRTSDLSESDDTASFKIVPAHKFNKVQGNFIEKSVRGSPASLCLQDRQIQTKKENIPPCKFIPPRIMTRSRILSLPSRKGFPAKNLHREFAFKGKRPREPSLDNSIDKAPHTEDFLKCKFLPPILRGITNAIGSKKSTEGEKACRFAAALKDPPDLGDHNQPGPVFGAALEDQIPSPDFPNVPLVLQATIAALESRGLHFMGLYRVPGRHSEINRFVCVSNLSALNPRFMLSLPTWNDIKALTGVVKVFLRRLPKPICDPESWGHLADTLPVENEHMSEASLFATLRGIRSNLLKDRSTSSIVWQWRFATMDFLFNHLRRIVALEKANNCNFKCIAICFGPSLFNADSQSQTKFNALLELMLQHWPWLKAELNKEIPSSSQQIRAYIEKFLENGPELSEDFKALANLKSAGSGREVLDVVKRIFDRVR